MSQNRIDESRAAARLLARIAAGLEGPAALGEGSRWARTGRTVEPDPRFAGAVDDRYARFLDLSA